MRTSRRLTTYAPSRLLFVTRISVCLSIGGPSPSPAGSMWRSAFFVVVPLILYTRWMRVTQLVQLNSPPDVANGHITL